MNKKLIAILLTAALMVGSTVSAFADSTSFNAIGGADINNVEPASVEHTGDVKVPKISVTICSLSSNVWANPYGLEVLDAKGKTTQDTLVGDIITVSNNSNMKVSVGIGGYIEVPARTDSKPGIKVVTTKPKSVVAKEKTVYVDAVVWDMSDTKVLHTQKVTTSNGNPTVEAVKPVAAMIYTQKTEKSKPASIALRPVLAAGTGDAPIADTARTGEIQIKLTGATTYTEDGAWDSADKFKVNTIFDIKATDDPVSSFKEPTS